MFKYIVDDPSVKVLKLFSKVRVTLDEIKDLITDDLIMSRVVLELG